MKTHLSCFPCFVEQTLGAIRRLTPDPALHERALREVLRHAAQHDLATPPPVMGRIIYDVVREVTGLDDPYLAEKKLFNALALSLVPELRRTIDGSSDPLAAAVRLAAAGNIVDFGIHHDLHEGHVRDAIRLALDQPLDPALLNDFRRAIAAARDILYLGDNTGEIVFDRLLLERLPREHITFVVRGKPIINDALMEDAVETGITSLVPVIDNGSDIPGTWLPDCSPEFRARIARADLVISKGQGNYETLDGPVPTFFLLKVKCSGIAENVGQEIGSLVLAAR